MGRAPYTPHPSPRGRVRREFRIYPVFAKGNDPASLIVTNSRRRVSTLQRKVIEKGKRTLTGFPFDLGTVVFQCLEASLAFLRNSFSAWPSFSIFTFPSESTVTMRLSVYGNFFCSLAFSGTFT